MPDRETTVKRDDLPCPNPFCDGYGDIDISPGITGRSRAPGACRVGPHPIPHPLCVRTDRAMRSRAMPEPRESSLLTDEAVQAATDVYGPVAQGAVREFVYFHRTEGREKLVERVAAAIHQASDHPRRAQDVWPEAEAVVTALVGEPDSA